MLACYLPPSLFFFSVVESLDYSFLVFTTKSSQKKFSPFCLEQRRGLVDDNYSASPLWPHALSLQGRLQEVVSKIAPNNQYNRRWISGVRLIKRMWARRIP